MARQRKSFKQGFVRRTQQESADIAALEATIAAGAPAPGTNVVGSAAPHPSDNPELIIDKATKGQAQPISKRTARGVGGSKGTSDGGNAVGPSANGNPGADPGYAHAKLFTELPISRQSQVWKQIIP